MTSFHFGEGERQLFGVHHHAEAADARPPAVLLCNPFGEEAIRAHRVFRILAERLARAGSHVLRFDYFGTGDSLGDCGEVTFSGMADDIQSAHEELVDISGATRVVWVGLRLGAAAAIEAATSPTRGLSGLLLWDPVVNGEAFLLDTAHSHISHLASVFDQPPQTITRRVGAPSAAPTEAMGFVVSDQMNRELKSYDAMTLAQRPARSVAIVAGEDEVAAAEVASMFEALHAKTKLCANREEVTWNSDQAMNEFIIPAKNIEDIVALIGDWR